MTASVAEALRDLFDEPAPGYVSYLNDGGQFVTFPYRRRGPREVFTIEIDRAGHSGSLGGRSGWRP
jgi:hypothetical protein